MWFCTRLKQTCIRGLRFVLVDIQKVEANCYKISAIYVFVIKYIVISNDFCFLCFKELFNVRAVA